MPSRPLRSGSHISERSGWRMQPPARSRNMISMTAMQSDIGRRDFILSLFIYFGSIFFPHCYLWFLILNVTLNMRPIYCYFFILSFAVVSCVSTGTYKSLQVEKSKSDSLYTWAMATLKTSQNDNARLAREKAAMKDSMY